jgi:hypothetical protein
VVVPYRWVGDAPGFLRIPAVVSQVGDWVELARIGQYYATEDMLGPSYGQDTLKGYYADLVHAYRLEEEAAAKDALQEGRSGTGSDDGTVSVEGAPGSSGRRSSQGAQPDKKSKSGLFYRGLGMPPTTVLAAKAIKAADAFTAARGAFSRTVPWLPSEPVSSTQNSQPPKR